MRLANIKYRSVPWRIHGLTSDFRVEDVWKLPATSAPGALTRFAHALASADLVAELLLRDPHALRDSVVAGSVLGLDGPGAGLGARVKTLRDRLPVDLCDALWAGLRSALLCLALP